MLAIIAAIFFALDLLLRLAHVNLGSVLTYDTLLYAGLLFVALHLAGVGPAMRWGRRR